MESALRTNSGEPHPTSIRQGQLLCRGIVLLALLSFLAFSGLAAASTNIVLQGADFQQAINSASPGDTLAVQSGVYGGNLAISKSLNVVCSDTNLIQFSGNVSIQVNATVHFVRAQFAGALAVSTNSTLILSQSVCVATVQTTGGKLQAVDTQMAGLTASGGEVALVRCASSGDISLTNTAFNAFRLNTTRHIFGTAPVGSGTQFTVAQSYLQVVVLNGYRAYLGYNSLFGDARNSPQVLGYPIVIGCTDCDTVLVGNLAYLYAVKRRSAAATVLTVGGTLRASNNRIMVSGDNFDQDYISIYGFLLHPTTGVLINNSIFTYVTQAYGIVDEESGIGSVYNGGPVVIRGNVIKTARANDPSARVQTFGVRQLISSNIVECAFNCIEVNNGPAFDGVSGTDSLLTDPLVLGLGDQNNFVGTLSPDNSWFSLQGGSPCINAGPPGAIYNDADGSRNDIGYSGGPFWKPANYTNDGPILLSLLPALAQTVVAGSNAVLTIASAGEGPLSYQWYFKATPLAGATNATLTLSNAQPAQAGNYFIIVSNSFGSVTSQVATLTVETTFSLLGPGAFSEPGRNSYGAAWGDYDNDGKADLFVANLGNQGNYLFHNNGNGTFTRVTIGPVVTDALNSYAGIWGDYDNDGDLDLFVANDGQNNALYRNDGGGNFTRIVSGPLVSDGGRSFSSAWGDYDRDGYLDIIVGNANEPVGVINFLYHNNRDGTFSRVSNFGFDTDIWDSRGTQWTDLDGDGDLDLVVLDLLPGVTAFYLNNGNGTLTRQTPGPFAGNSDQPHEYLLLNPFPFYRPFWHRKSLDEEPRATRAGQP